MSIEDKRIFRLTAKEPFTGALVPNLKEKESHPLRSSVCLFSFRYSLKQALLALNEKSHPLSWMAFFSLFQLWAMRDSNPRPPACKAGALNQLS